MKTLQSITVSVIVSQSSIWHVDELPDNLLPLLEAWGSVPKLVEKLSWAVTIPLVPFALLLWPLIVLWASVPRLLAIGVRIWRQLAEALYYTTDLLLEGLGVQGVLSVGVG